MDVSRYLHLFVAECREHVGAARSIVGAPEGLEGRPNALRELLRHAHSLKGIASSMGFTSMAYLAHSMEDLVDALRTGGLDHSDARSHLLSRGLACFERLVVAAERGEPVRDPEAASLAGAIREALRGEAPRDAVRPEADRGDAPPAPRVADFPLAEEGDGRPACEASRGPVSWLRIVASEVDAVSGEVLDVLREHDRALAALERGSCPEAADRLERCRSRLHAVRGRLGDMRLAPFGQMASRMVESARGLAQELGKRLRVEVAGAGIRVDRTILDGLADALLHAVRNSVDHGIEFPEARLASGKDPAGTIRLAAEGHGESLRISVWDDGRGFDAAALRRAAVSGGFLAADRAERLSERQAYRLALLPGLTTSPRLTSVSGRGFGGDALQAAVAALGGRLDIESEPGRFSLIAMSFPRALSLLEAILVRCRGETYALPLGTVERVVPPGRIATVEPPAVSLASRLRISGDEAGPAAGEAVVCVAEGSRVTLVVDEILGRSVIAVQPLGPPLDRLAAFSGAGVAEDGTLALVLAL